MKFRPGGISLDFLFRKVLPRGLFGRSLLTVLIPLILLQVRRAGYFLRQPFA